MASSLLTLLAERLQMDVADVEGSLTEYVATLKSTLAAGEPVALPGVGTFTGIGSAMQFTPDEALTLLSNSPFGGTGPLTVPSTEDDATLDTSSDEPSAEETPAVPTETEDQKDDTGEAVAVPAAPAEDVPEPSEESEGGDDEAEPSFAESPNDTDEETHWEPPAEEAAEHPLGPLPPPSFEDADFSVINELAGTEHPESDGPAAPGEEEPAAEKGEMVAEPETTDADEATDPEIPEAEEELFDLLQFKPFEEEPGPETPDEAEEVPGPDPGPEPEESQAGAAPEAEPEPEPAPSPEATSLPPAPKPRPPRSRTPHRERESSGRLIWVVLIVVGLVGGGIVAYNLLKPASPPPPTNGGVVPTDTLATAQAETPAEPAMTDTTETTTPVTEAPPAPAVIDRNAGGWTIIVGSEIDRAVAERLAASYRDLGVPVDVLVGTSGGVTRYRVAVGQYPDRTEARGAIASLGDRLPDGAWPLRVRPGM